MSPDFKEREFAMFDAILPLSALYDKCKLFFSEAAANHKRQKAVSKPDRL